MSPALWGPPAVLAGLVAFLWVASWLDSLVTPALQDVRTCGDDSRA